MPTGTLDDTDIVCQVGERSAMLQTSASDEWIKSDQLWSLEDLR